MAQVKDVFERKETKYHISAAQREVVERSLREHGYAVDAYGETWISSRYYDTPRYDLISTSLDRPVYKEKFRLRSYSKEAFLEPGELVFAELKKKYKGIVYKRRIQATLGETRQLIATGELPLATSTPSMNVRELQAFFGRHRDLTPAIDIRCRREAWAPLDASDPAPLRVTFDGGLQARDDRGGESWWETVMGPARGLTFDVAEGEDWWDVIPGDESILEIKAAGSFPRWLVDALSAGRIYPDSFSKYGTAYQQLMNGTNECLYLARAN